MDKIIRIGKGYLLTAAIFVAISLVFSLILCFTPMSMKYGDLILLAILSVCTFIFSIFVGNSFGKRGLLLGFLSGAVFIITFVFLATTALKLEFISSVKNPLYLIPLLFSLIGGIVGANLRK